MKTKTAFFIFATAWASLAAPSRGLATSKPPTGHGPGVASAESVSAPQGFIPNVGQLPDVAAKYVLRDRGMAAYFTARGFVLWTGQTTPSTHDGLEVKQSVAPRWEIVGAKPVDPVGGETFSHTVSFFRGNDPANWRANVPAYRELRYPEILTGVELRVESRKHGFEYTFHVQPHTKPDLRFRYEGITGLETSSTGDLVVRTALGHFTESRPVAFQWIDGAKRDVPSSFEIVSNREYRIAVGPYDERHELIVDPVLDWSTSIGGSFNDSLSVVKVAPTGDVVVAGLTFSTDLPSASGFGPTPGINLGSDQVWHTDIYLARFSADGTQLQWAGYLGGAGATSESMGRNKALAIDPAGDVYVTTHTRSPDFPVWPLGNSVHQGQVDASITRIKGDGSAILWSRLMGASADDYGQAVALHGTDLYLSGTTTSPDFPVTARAFGGMQDAFVTKLNVADGTVVWSAFLGGSMEERISGILADASGVILFGDTDSADFHEPDFPAPAGHDRTLGGGNDAFLTKLASNGAILWSTYLGGSQAETTAILSLPQFPRTWGFTDFTLDSTGSIVAAGQTWSSDFPNTTGRFQSALAGVNDAYVAKLTPGGVLLWATYLGGVGPQNAAGLQDAATGVAVNPWDEILVGGVTLSPDFPITADALKPVMQADGFQDGFMAKLERDGQQLLYSTYVGNDGWNDAVLALDYGLGKVVVAGWHFDTLNPITAGTFRQECNNCGSETLLMSFLDAFIAHDGFESGNYAGGLGWAGDWTASGDASILALSGPHSGSGHVRLRGSTGYLQRTVSVPPGSITLRLGFWAKVNSFESGDRADVLVRSTGASFTTVASFTSAHSDSNYHYYEVDLTSFLPATQIHLAFDAAMNASNDNLYLDDIRLTGTSGSVPPIANAGPDQSVSDADNNGVQTVTLNGSASADPDGGGVVNYEWREGATVLGSGATLVVSLPLGAHAITLTVTDDEGATDDDTVQIAINPNQTPFANAGADQTVTDTDNSGAQIVTLNGAASSDADGSILSYEWKEGATVLGTGASLNPSLSVGLHTITLTVTDNGGASASDDVQVTVNPHVAALEVFNDSFEVSEWNGLWTEDSQNDWFRSAQRGTQGTRSAEVDGSATDASLTSIAINLQGRTSATITFDWFIESGLDGGEYLEFRISTNGGATWTQKAILRGNVDPENSWRSVAVELTGITQLKLQFRGRMSADDEDANVDNVRVVAQ